jgi:DNA primase
VIIAYDGDGAGIKASQRAIGILEKLDLKVRVLRMSGAKDPDELIRTKGPEAFRALLEASENQVDYRLRTIAARYVLDSPEQKYEFLKEAYGVVARLPDRAQRDLYAARLAEQVGVKEDAVRGDVEKTRAQLIRRARSNENRSAVRAPERPAAAQGRKLYFDDPRSAAAEQGLIRLLYLDAGCARGQSLPEPGEFSSQELRHIYEALCARIERHAPISLSLLCETLSREEIDLLVRLDQEPVNLANGEQAMADYISIIHERHAARQAAAEPQRTTDELMAIRDKYRLTKAYK